jgi:hypothetical protein
VETVRGAHQPKSVNTEIAESTEDTEKNQVGFPNGALLIHLFSLLPSVFSVPSVLKDFGEC